METVSYPAEYSQIATDAFKAVHSVLADHILRHKNRKPHYDPMIGSAVIAGSVKAVTAITEAIGDSNGDALYEAVRSQVEIAVSQRFPGWSLPTP